MKKYLFLAMALLGLVSCAKDDIANGNNPIHNGEIEESYIAINLSASDITRAQTGFDDGTAEERAVSHADFFFFDEAGKPFNVNVSGTNDDQWTEGTGTGRNHLRVTTINWTKDEDSDDISDTAKPVMLLKTYKGEYPSQIVAVLNWSPDNKPYSLSDLHDAVNVQSTFKNSENEDTNYFVMSNAVYAQNGNAVYATPLTIDNIKKSEDEAKTAPVTIYGERVAAKVTVKSIDSSNNKFDVGQDFTYTTTDGENTTTDVYAHIVGWELYNDNPQSKLLKQIDATWDDTVLGFTWNDAPWYRCFWANSLAMPNDTVTNTAPFVNGDHTYIGENTTANNTKVIIKAVLKNADGTQVAEIALWNNVQYVGELALRTAVANTLVNTYYSLTTVDEKNVYTGLKPEDLQCVAGGTAVAPEGVAANEVYFQLSNEGAAKNWYKLVNGEYKIENRIMLEGEVIRDGKNVFSFVALNEATLFRSTLKKAFKSIIYINGMDTETILGDGVVISTPTGSTAYGLSAGGPILYPTLDTFVIVPICPHTLNARPLVVPSNEVISVKTSDKLLSVSIDGFETEKCIDKITIKSRSQKAVLAFLKKDCFYEVLRDKLNWGKINSI